MPQRDRVGVREIRQYLSVYLDRVKRGEALEITERGRPVAMLVPLPGQSSLIARLVAEGRATAPTQPTSDVPMPRPVKGKAPSISKLLDEMREDRG